MKMLARTMQSWLRSGAPSTFARLFRLLYGASNVRIGSNFRCDSLPRCLIDPGAQLDIGDNVEFRSGVELRVHGKARLVIEDDVRIDRGVRILAANESVVRIGAGARIGLYSVLNGGDCIDVGEKSLISGFVYLQSSMHRFANSGAAIKDQGYDHGPVSLGQGAWLAAHVVIMPGRNVGANAIVGSNAVVTEDVEPGMIVAGVPAKPISSSRV
ncbi:MULTISPECIES: acyltransferase [Sphingomonadales]|uniref:Acyltransferase n=2 Tax=Sphingomonadaceae TaxID=41297 RepID=T0K2T6_9SPHN|nr:MULTISPECIES: acyltransferase [Sphingomonadaceae]EQB30879.1 hypothetical protein M529_17405 [Sphingobium ummariense RL-3]PCF90161.1 hypothetical protein CPA46_16505 [Sphingopyxis terrae subsp. ummariensis]